MERRPQPDPLPREEREPLPMRKQREVTPEYIRWAVCYLREYPNDHWLGKSIDYDVIVGNDLRLPPKAVFGLAAAEALGLEDGTFKFGSTEFIRGLIKSAGFAVVPKGEMPQQEHLPEDPDEREWIEGHLKFETGLTRGRAGGLAQCKKNQFRNDNGGRLFCEKCKKDPVDVYGEAGVACIEVHHKVPVAEMEPGHKTTLDELMCVCANCHRALHYEMRNP